MTIQLYSPCSSLTITMGMKQSLWMMCLFVKLVVPGYALFSMTASSELNKCSLESVTSQQQQANMLQCFIQCWQNPCCRAINVTSCEQSYLNTDGMDFVREVILFSYFITLTKLKSSNCIDNARFEAVVFNGYVI